MDEGLSTSTAGALPPLRGLVFHRSPEFLSSADVVAPSETLGHHWHRLLLRHRSFLVPLLARLCPLSNSAAADRPSRRFPSVHWRGSQDQWLSSSAQWNNQEESTHSGNTNATNNCVKHKKQKLEVLSPLQHITQRIFRQTFCLGLSHAVVDVLCTRCVTACFSFSGARTPEVCDSVSLLRKQDTVEGILCERNGEVIPL